MEPQLAWLGLLLSRARVPWEVCGSWGQRSPTKPWHGHPVPSFSFILAAVSRVGGWWPVLSCHAALVSVPACQTRSTFICGEPSSLRRRPNPPSTSGRRTPVRNDRSGQPVYPIANISGRLFELSSLQSDPQGLTSDDKSRLRDFLSANHPSPANPETPPPTR